MQVIVEVNVVIQYCNMFLKSLNLRNNLLVHRKMMEVILRLMPRTKAITPPSFVPLFMFVRTTLYVIFSCIIHHTSYSRDSTVP
jgi:hypothetical protein